MKRNLLLPAAAVLVLCACNPFESTFDKQVKACTESVKLGLGDPGSLELVSKEGIALENGWFRVALNFTAKNAMGGRVRASTLCGFKSKDDTALNSDDFVNRQREMSRSLKEMGVQ